MNLMLDTHAILWFWWEDKRLSDSAREAIIEPTNRKLVSMANCWEITIKLSLKKLDLGQPYHPFVEEQIAANNFEMLPIRHEHLAVVADLPFHHRDPFDRLTIA